MPVELFNVPPYIVDDVNNRYTISVSKLRIDTSGVTRQDTALIRKDGLSLDGTNVIHKFAAQMDSSATTNSFLFPWGLSSIVGDYKTILDTNGECLNLIIVRGGGSAATFFIQEFINGSGFADNFAGSVGIEYRFIIEWDKTIGAFGRVTVEIYDDEYITLVDTIFLNLHSAETYSNFYPANTFKDGNTVAADGFSQNYDLGDVVPAFNPSWARNSNQIIGIPQ